MKADFSFFFSPTSGVVCWDGVKVPHLHRCEECHPQDAGEQRRHAGIEHRTQLVYSWAEMGVRLQQNPGAKGCLTLHSHASPCWFIFSEVRDYIWVLWSSRRQNSQKAWVWPRTSTAPSRSFSPRWASVRSLSGFFLRPALYWTLFVLNCRNTE